MEPHKPKVGNAADIFEFEKSSMVSFASLVDFMRICFKGVGSLLLISSLLSKVFLTSTSWWEYRREE
jgi:hypothetical protein